MISWLRALLGFPRASEHERFEWGLGVVSKDYLEVRALKPSPGGLMTTA